MIYWILLIIIIIFTKYKVASGTLFQAGLIMMLVGAFFDIFKLTDISEMLLSAALILWVVGIVGTCIDLYKHKL
ncbi:MAG TPA: hypothetical protein VFI61_01495 [Patescibacteria group bacterium]|nr:hypothetical protein [Patescibacteria group bacterium]